ncbi:MAG: hypothetical protein KAX98_10710 [Nitrospira sp.]|nr:hypothetical protein [Nitrospira sp.]
MKKILALSAALLFAAPAFAQLSSGQMATLKSTCDTDQTCAALAASADDVALAAWFNAADPGACIVWRSDVRIEEANSAMVWTEIDAMTTGKARIWEWMSKLGTLDARSANIRQGLSDAFSSATSTRTALIALAKRTATRAEKVLSSGACTTANPSITTFVGSVTYAQASLIRS